MALRKFNLIPTLEPTRTPEDPPICRTEAELGGCVFIDNMSQVTFADDNDTEPIPVKLQCTRGILMQFLALCELYRASGDIGPFATSTERQAFIKSPLTERERLALDWTDRVTVVAIMMLATHMDHERIMLRCQHIMALNILNDSVSALGDSLFQPRRQRRTSTTNPEPQLTADEFTQLKYDLPSTAFAWLSATDAILQHCDDDDDDDDMPGLE